MINRKELPSQVWLVVGWLYRIWCEVRDNVMTLIMHVVVQVLDWTAQLPRKLAG